MAASRREVPLVSAVLVAIGAGFFACVGDDPGSTSSGDGGSDATIDESTGDVSSTDAGSDSSCSTTGKFGALVPIEETFSNSKDGRLSLTLDETVGVFDSNRALTSSDDIYLTRRASAAASFGPPSLVPERDAGSINTVSQDLDPAISGDGLSLVWVQNGDIDGGRKGGHFIATRANRELPFGNVQGVFLATNSDGGPIPTPFRRYPFIVPDGSALYTHAVYVENNQQVIHLEHFVRTGSGRYGELSFVTDLGPNVVAVVTNTAETEIVFTNANERHKLFRASRATKLLRWENIEVIDELTQPVGTEPVPGALSSDGCRLYLTVGAGGSDKHYVATRGR
jgi:hypothetical protein